MPVTILLEFPGVTQELYETVGESLKPGPPPGLLYHTCGAVPGGWRIVDVWDSQEGFDRFLEDTYLPAMSALGGPAPSRREVMLTHHAGEVRR